MDTQISKTPHDWHPADIKAHLEKKGVSLRRLALEHGYSHFQRVLTSPWWAAEQIVARALGFAAKDVWPSRYVLPRDRAEQMTRKVSVSRSGTISRAKPKHAGLPRTKSKA